MSAHLASMDSFRLEAVIEYDEVPTPGSKVEYEGDLTIDLARPDRLHVDYRDDEAFKQIWISDGEVTLSDLDLGAYAKAPADADVETTLDRLYEEHGGSYRSTICWPPTLRPGCWPTCRSASTWALTGCAACTAITPSSIAAT